MTQLRIKPNLPASQANALPTRLETGDIANFNSQNYTVAVSICQTCGSSVDVSASEIMANECI